MKQTAIEWMLTHLEYWVPKARRQFLDRHVQVLNAMKADGIFHKNVTVRAANIDGLIAETERQIRSGRKVDEALYEKLAKL